MPIVITNATTTESTLRSILSFSSSCWPCSISDERVSGADFEEDSGAICVTDLKSARWTLNLRREIGEEEEGIAEWATNATLKKLNVTRDDIAT